MEINYHDKLLAGEILVQMDIKRIRYTACEALMQRRLEDIN
jgi:hypothetical protein